MSIIHDFKAINKSLKFKREPFCPMNRHVGKAKKMVLPGCREVPLIPYKEGDIEGWVCKTCVTLWTPNTELVWK